jgi:hypothetical protein
MRGQAERDDPLFDRVHLREPALDVTRVGHQAAQRESGTQLDVLLADHARVLHGALGCREAARAGIVHHAPGSRLGEHLRVDSGRLKAAHQLLRLSQLRPAVATPQRRDQPGELHREPRGAQRVALRLREPLRPLRYLQRALALTAEAARDGRLRHQVEITQRRGGMAAARRIDLRVVDRPQHRPYLVGHLLPQLHRSLQQMQLLGVGVPPPGLDGGAEHGGQRLGRVVGVVPVRREARRALRVPDERRIGLQRLCVTPVEPGALAGQQVVADGLAREGVPEAVAVAVGRGQQDVRAHRGPQRLDEVVLAQPGDGEQQPVLNGRAALRDEPRHPLRVFGQRLDPYEKDVAQGIGKPRGALAGHAAGEFLDEEGVAVRALEDAVHHGGLGLDGEDPGHLAVDLAAVEAGQLDALDGTHPVELGEKRPQRVTPVHVVGAVGRDHDQPPAVQGAEEVGEEMAGGGVRPVQVLQHQDDRTVGGDPLQQPRGELEEAGHALLVVRAVVAAGCLPQLGQQPRQLVLLARGGSGELFRHLAVHSAQGGREGRERQSVRAYLDAAADRDDGLAATCLGEQLLHEAGLADARLTADEQCLRLPRGGAGERVGELGQFGGAADEHRADGPGFHAAEHRTAL